MRDEELNYITDVLQGKNPDGKGVDWYTVIGFLQSHRIGGYFYRKLRQNRLVFPVKAGRILSEAASKQRERNILMGGKLMEVVWALEEAKIRYAVLMGNILSHADFKTENGSEYRRSLYGAGERFSGGIDLLVMSADVGRVKKVLSSLGYAAGHYDPERDFVREPARKKPQERGVYAPFQLLTGNVLLPHVEVRLESLFGDCPEGITGEALGRNVLYAADCGEIRSLEKIDFLLHLILHLYRERRLSLAAANGRSTALYKLLDIHLLLKEVDQKVLLERIFHYRVREQAAAVLKAVKEVFGETQFNGGVEEELNTIFLPGLGEEDCKSEVKNGWRTIRERLKCFDCPEPESGAAAPCRTETGAVSAE